MGSKAPKASKVMKKTAGDQMSLGPMKKLKKEAMNSNIFGHQKTEPTVSPNFASASGSFSPSIVMPNSGVLKSSLLPSPDSLLALEITTKAPQTPPTAKTDASEVKGKKMRKGLIQDKRDRADKLVKGSSIR